MDEVSFPYACIATSMARRRGRSVPWHWHSAFEVVCLTSGTLEYRTPERSVLLRQGDAAFVNAGVLHSCRTDDPNSCEYYTHLFDMHFLSGTFGSVFEEKYFQPIVRSGALPLWHIRPDTRLRMQMIDAALEAVELSRTEPEGYEFDLREALCRFWRGLLADTAEVRAGTPLRSNPDDERMKLMMGFVQEHCGEKLTLEDIAASASISARECTRCFRRSIDMTPVSYLTQCRVRAAAKLLSETAKSVLEISEECGFSSPSYFSRVFREIVGCTPKSYRGRPA